MAISGYKGKMYGTSLDDDNERIRNGIKIATSNTNMIFDLTILFQLAENINGKNKSQGIPTAGANAI